MVFPTTMESDSDDRPLPGSKVARDMTGVWEAVRRTKDPLLAKSSPKVDSLRHHVAAPAPPPSPPESLPPERLRNVRRRTSAHNMVTDDGKFVTTTFNVPGVRRADMHIAFRRTHLVVSWKSTQVSSVEGVVVHEVHSFERIIPLPEGTEVDEVVAVKETGQLSITYPNCKAIRIE